MFCSPSSSFLCQNLSFCARRYCATVSDLIEGPTESFVAKAVDACFDLEIRQKSSMLLELILIRDGFLHQSAIGQAEVEDIIFEITVN